VVADLVVPAGGALTGRLTRGGAPVAGSVDLEREPPALVRTADADADGTYRVEPLPAGRYRVTASPLPTRTADAAASLVATVDIADDTLARLDLDFIPAITLVVTVDPGDRQPAIVEFWLLRGPAAPTTRDQLDDLDDRIIDQRMFGGAHALNRFVHHDLDPGRYTACAAAGDARLGCVPVDLHATPAEQQVTLRLP